MDDLPDMAERWYGPTYPPGTELFYLFLAVYGQGKTDKECECFLTTHEYANVAPVSGVDEDNRFLVCYVERGLVLIRLQGLQAVYLVGDATSEHAAKILLRLTINLYKLRGGQLTA